MSQAPSSTTALRREIPAAQWTTFCKRFTRQHHGGRCALDVTEPGRPVRRVAHGWALQGVAVEAPHTGPATIVITLADGRPAGSDDVPPHMAHTVTAPQYLWHETTPDGAQLGLAIEAANGEITRLRFRVPVVLEALDGLSP